MLCPRISVSQHQMLAVWLDSSHSPRIFLLWFKPLLLLPLVFLLSSFSANILSSITSFSTQLTIWGSISLTNSPHLGHIGSKFSSFGNSFGWFWRILEKWVRLILLWETHYWYVLVWQFHHWLNPKTCSLTKKCWSRTIERVEGNYNNFFSFFFRNNYNMLLTPQLKPFTP